MSLNARLETCLRHQASSENFQSEIDAARFFCPLFLVESVAQAL
jgi:hypothetical protein